MYLPTITTKIPAIFAIIAIAFSIIPVSFALANEEVPENPVEVAAKNNLQVSICLNETAINFNLEGECNFHYPYLL